MLLFAGYVEQATEFAKVTVEEVVAIFRMGTRPQR
jgi:hypothetical protein